MKILGYEVRSPFTRIETRSSVQTSDLKDPSAWLIYALAAQLGSTAGVNLTPLKALGVATVFACVRVRADAISTLPMRLMKRDGKSMREAVEHPLYSVLKTKWNDEMTAADANFAMQSNLALRANAYAEVLRDIDGDARGLYPYEPGLVDVSRDPQTKKLVYRITDSTRTMRNGPIPFKDIVHFKGMTFNGIQGTDTIATVRECISLAVALQDNAAKFFSNGSRPGGVLEHPTSLSEEAQERLRKQIDSMTIGGNGTAYKTMLLEEGLKYTALRSENKDSQFDESRLNQDLQICRVFGVPPHKVGIMSGQPRANVEQDNLAFVTEILRPICIRQEQVLNMQILTDTEREQGYFIEYDLDDFARGDMLTRFQAYALARQWGWYSGNDVRYKERLPSVEGLDTYLQPLNMADMTEATDILKMGKTSNNQNQ